MNFPLSKILNAINSRTKVIAIANPNNPTGTLLAKNDLLKIIKKAPDAIILIDEAYFHYTGLTMKPFIKKYSNLVITQTFSKAFGLAGLRLGYILSQPENIEILRKVQSPYSVNRVAIIAAEAVLKNPASAGYVRQYTNEVARARALLRKFLDASGVPLVPGTANFILAKFGWFTRPIAEALRKDGILVRQPVPEWLRIGVGTITQTKRLIRSLRKILRRRTIIFDFDGVLVNVSRSYHYAIRDTVAYFSNKVIPLKLIKDMKVKGGYNDDWILTYDLLKRFGKRPDFKALKRYFQSRYCGPRFNGFIRNETWLLNRGILEKLSANYTLAIVTARPRIETNYALKRAKAMKFFSAIIPRDDFPEKYQKPHPAGIIKALKLTNSIYGVYFGDTPDDMQTAKNAGITGIGVLPPQNHSRALKNALKKNGASVILPNINRILEVL